MINQELKKAAHEPAHDAVIHNYDRTQLHTCIDEACPHHDHIVHYLGMFGAMWIDDTGQIHNHCELKPLPKPNKTKTSRALQIRATELGGARTRTFLTQAGVKQREAIQAREREREKIEAIRDLPLWMLRPCFRGQIPAECMFGLDKCEDTKLCLKQRLGEYARRRR